MRTNKPLSLRTILMPIDFSKSARRALSKQFGARIMLLHIVAPRVYPAEVPIVVPKEQVSVNAVRKHLIALGQKLVPRKLRGEMIVRNGQPGVEGLFARRVV